MGTAEVNLKKGLEECPENGHNVFSLTQNLSGSKMALFGTLRLEEKRWRDATDGTCI